MGRSPSPAPRRRDESKRDRDRERDRDRRRRERSRSPRGRRRRSAGGGGRRRSRSRSTPPKVQQQQQQQGGSGKAQRAAAVERPPITEADLEGKSPEEQEMIRTMGFGGFDSTKNRKVDNNDAGEVQVVLKRKYRQYMNRKGGFNRPLDFVA